MTIQECEERAYTDGLAAGLRTALRGNPGPAMPSDGGITPDPAVPGHRLAEAEGVALLPSQGIPDDPELSGRLAAARLGTTRRALEAAARHLDGRISGEGPLIQRQLLAGAIADAAAGIELARALLGTPYVAHEVISDLGWEITKLFGGAGYITDQPTRALYVSALIADAWGATR
ncbi:acyl-CoA dehydrogenase family protein [Streptosporangium saharense]|uniref:acyl-CoA dehydrogenase family protein n=1 Tax=Streptosporangium saharense TaxID=1706840 RepID=UPI00332DD16A